MEAPLVSDLVVAVLRASHEALALHYERVFRDCRSFEDEYWCSVRLERGDVSDLMDPSENAKGDIGFPHSASTALFRNHLRPLLRGARAGRRIERGIDRHLWGADYDRKTRSLFPTGTALKQQEEHGPEPNAPRTRISAVLQQAMLRSRGVLQSEKAVTATRDPNKDPASVFVPSPYYVARQVLTDPEALATEVYANAAVRTDLAFHLKQRFGELKLNYENVARALDDIHARASTSKKAKATGELRGEAVFVRHYLASLGVLSLQVEWDRPGADPERSDLRIDRFLADPANLFDYSPRGRGAQVSFRLDPEYAEFPDAGELLNELQGLPLPIEGAAAIFNGGLRFASAGDIVASISGPSGAGKTTACLSLAASLAPLGCRTLFLSCEEAAEDIQARLGEAMADHIRQSTPLFRCTSLEELRNYGNRSKWFRAHKMRVNEDTESDNGSRSASDVVKAIQDLIQEAIDTAPLFDVFRDPEKRAALPVFARRVIVIDGFHQLFRESDSDGAALERALRTLVDHCRKISALFVFTVAEHEPPMQRLDYLCDLVIHLDRVGFENTTERPSRSFKLLKARRQPALVGSHVLHLTGPKCLRVKPNMAARAHQAKARRWIDPDPKTRIQLADGWEELRIQNRSQVLIYGKGSSGKAGLGLYLLNRKPTPFDGEKPSPDLFEGKTSSKPPESAFAGFEARVLVISFLYQSQYYKRLGQTVRMSTARRPRASKHTSERWLLDVMSLYPGGLTPEDFIAKVEGRLLSAELRGIPYTGVMIDGIHSVFVQFPALEDDSTAWPQLYSMLRRRGVTVVTTHTEFELRESSASAQPVWVDFEHAQKKSAPLLSALVSAADYVFELSAISSLGDAMEYRLKSRAALGEDPPAGFVTWNRNACRLGSWQAGLVAADSSTRT